MKTKLCICSSKLVKKIKHNLNELYFWADQRVLLKGPKQEKNIQDRYQITDLIGRRRELIFFPQNSCLKFDQNVALSALQAKIMIFFPLTFGKFPFLWVFELQVSELFVDIRRYSFGAHATFPRYKYFLPPDTHTYMCVKGVRQC